jgi:hypothetical protein
MDGANYRNFRPDHPTHNAPGFLSNAFDTGHQVGEVTQFAKKFPRLFKRGSQFHLI